MTHDELIEKVARGACCGKDCNAPWEAECNRRVFEDCARAAIDIVLEEAAKIADDEWYRGTPAIEFSRAIRALKSGYGE